MSEPAIRIAPPLFQMAPDYDHLTLMEKVEVFEHAVNNTAGDDLAKLLWLKSPSSEVRWHLRPNGEGDSLPHPFFRPNRGFRDVVRGEELSPCCCAFCFQVWFDRRTNYTRSLAVMSMVGYILGLGDR